MCRVVLIIAISMVCQATWSASHKPQDFLKAVAGTKNEGSEIVQHYCAVCHAAIPEIPVGAPRIGEKADWNDRLALGLDVLFKHVDEGMGLMPARGGCFECSDEQLRLAIQAMLSRLPAK